MTAHTMHMCVMYGSWMMIIAGVLAAGGLCSGIRAPYGRQAQASGHRLQLSCADEELTHPAS